uniref:Peptidase_M41 domain-containing protein n=1 Tax=Globodera pallida TaxID=36090 RepID=A0A183CCP1_GLOPA
MTRKQKRGKILKEFNRLIRAAEGGDYNKSRICFHEAGHCFNVWFNQHGGTLCDVTCVQNGTIDGLTRHWSRRPATRASLRAEIAIKMGGKAAEMLTFGASLGHYADQPEWERKAKAVAETRATWRSLPNGLRTRAELKRRAQPIIAQAYTTAYSILEVWRPLLHKMALALFARGTLTQRSFAAR